MLADLAVATVPGRPPALRAALLILVLPPPAP